MNAKRTYLINTIRRFIPVFILTLTIVSPVTIFVAHDTTSLQTSVAYAADHACVDPVTASMPSALSIGAPTFSDANGTCTPSQSQALAATSKPPNGNYTCSYWDPQTWITGCWLPSILTNIGLIFLEVGGFILEMVAYIFDTLIQHVVIGFGSLMQGPLIGAINTGWDAFRDLANILIIGMFTFIAISTVLGSKEYGYKRLVARVLVIAVLMNFSLLFTKMIIDASNFTAYQFYSQIAGSGGSSGTANSFDVAAAFLTPMGITSVYQFNTSNTVLTAGNSATSASGWSALAIGFFGAILLVGVAIVLAYGSILIVSRAIVLIVLMLTSSAAFATYLLPNFAGSRYGWKGWWEALINCAVFAPALMFFLAVSLIIVQKSSSLAKSTSFGDLAAHPTMQTNGGAWQLVLSYLIAVGLLFVSLKLSSHFANSTSGIQMSIAGMMAPLGLTARMGGMVARRYMGGSSAVEKAEEHRKLAEAKKHEASQLPPGDKYDKTIAEMNKHYAEMDKQKKRSTATFNLADTRPMRAVTGFLDVKGLASGQTSTAEKAAIRKTASEAKTDLDRRPPPLKTATTTPAATPPRPAAGPPNVPPKAAAAPKPPATPPQGAAKPTAPGAARMNAAAAQQAKDATLANAAKTDGGAGAPASKSAAEGPAMAAANEAAIANKEAAQALKATIANLGATRPANDNAHDSETKSADTSERKAIPVNEQNKEISREVGAAAEHAHSEAKGAARAERERTERAFELATQKSKSETAANEFSSRVLDNERYKNLTGGKDNVAPANDNYQPAANDNNPPRPPNVPPANPPHYHPQIEYKSQTPINTASFNDGKSLAPVPKYGAPDPHKDTAIQSPGNTPDPNGNDAGKKA